jgi:hypothetical protein
MIKTRTSLAALLITGMAALACHHSGLQIVTGGPDAGPARADAAATSGSDVSADQRDTEVDSASGGSVTSSIVGTCATAADCVAVLDYRAGFACWFASAASRADLSRDPCLVPWKPNPKCSTASPPAGCPGGLQVVNHSCPAIRCAIPTCTDGKCSLTGFGSQCDGLDAGTPDCEALRTTLVNELSAAQACDPSRSPTPCVGDYADTCGCEAPYDISNSHARAVQCAFEAWSDAHCPLADCGRTCVVPTAAGATCVPNATGTMGTCAWK